MYGELAHRLARERGSRNSTRRLCTSEDLWRLLPNSGCHGIHGVAMVKVNTGQKQREGYIFGDEFHLYV